MDPVVALQLAESGREEVACTDAGEVSCLSGIDCLGVSVSAVVLW